MSGDKVTIAPAAQATEALAGEIAALLPQLSSSARGLLPPELEEIVSAPGSLLLLARGEDGRLVGMLTLATYRIPTGLNAVIEDVVVDSTARGSGIGESLVREALAEAERRGARHVDLTSRPSREAANRLYQKMGFEKRETNVYRKALA